jgi:hypothetical protein
MSTGFQMEATAPKNKIKDQALPRVKWMYRGGEEERGNNRKWVK